MLEQLASVAHCQILARNILKMTIWQTRRQYVFKFRSCLKTAKQVSRAKITIHLGERSVKILGYSIEMRLSEHERVITEK